jgi:hypothetical protein
VIEALLAERSDLALVPISPAELPTDLNPGADGVLRISPGALGEVGGADSFFIARLQRLA